MTAPSTTEPVAPVAQATVTNLRASRKQTAAAKAKTAPAKAAPAKKPAAKATAKKAEPKEKGLSPLQRRQAMSEGLVRASWEINLDRVRELAGVPDLTDKEITAQWDRHQKYLSSRCYDANGKRLPKASDQGKSVTR